MPYINKPGGACVKVGYNQSPEFFNKLSALWQVTVQ